MRLLYVTWDGPEQNYLDSLFFPIFSRLRHLGVSTHVLQFSWDLEQFRAQTAEAARHHGVGYEVYAIPRRPLQAATALAVTWGAMVVRATARREDADVVMPRAYIPGAMALLARPSLRKRPLVWDSDGLMPDERVDFGGWSRRGLQYRAFRALERRLVNTADRVLTRTAAARDLLAQRAAGAEGRFTVVPNGKDAGEFRPGTAEERAEVRRGLGLAPQAPLLVYAGSIGPQYRPREMARCFGFIRERRPDAHFLILTGARELATAAMEAEGLQRESWTVKRLPPAEVPAVLRAADAGVSFRERSTSMRAVCPIKVAEYLLSGLPVLSNAGVGDIDVQLGGADPASLAPDFGEASLRGLADAFCGRFLAEREVFAARARELGIAHFSLEACVAGYHRALT